MYFVVPETLWIEDPAGTPAEQSEQEKMDAAAKGKSDPSEHLEIAQAPPRVIAGHVGHDWMPWTRPGEYLKICLSPITMVSSYDCLPSDPEREC